MAKTFIFTKTAITFYKVIAETLDEAGEILVKAMNDAEAYKTHTEVRDEDFIYYGEVEE